MVNRVDGGVTGQGSPQLDRSGPDVEVMVEKFQKIVDKALQKAADGDQLPADQAKQMTDSMNKFLEGSNSELRFEFHEKLNEYYVTIVDPKTHEVIKEIPSKKLMDAHAAMREFNGLFVNHKI
ncbi:MAG: flagellar protein FlaG [Psychrobacillus psychrotolerans]|uniref:flagellar protein FlaG n=1 Tax=Psychrobacillus psychrotolerans TaxID=126156 RepID=UPI003BB0C38D